MNIYLDIDGVLITKEIKPAEGVTEFLKYFTENHHCFWLTTHCRAGECRAEEYLEGVLPEKAMKYARKVKPTNWQTYKTEAIYFSRDFRWFDDNIMAKEILDLKKHNVMDNFVKVKRADLRKYIENGL